MRSLVQLDGLDVAERSATRRSSRSRSSFHALRRALGRIARLDFFSLEDEMGRAIDRAFADLAREMRK